MSVDMARLLSLLTVIAGLVILLARKLSTTSLRRT